MVSSSAPPRCPPTGLEPLQLREHEPVALLVAVPYGCLSRRCPSPCMSSRLQLRFAIARVPLGVVSSSAALTIAQRPVHAEDSLDRCALLGLAEMFAFASVLLFGPELGAVTLCRRQPCCCRVAPEARRACSRSSTSATSTLSVWISGKLFFLVARSGAALPRHDVVRAWLDPAARWSSRPRYFVVNSGLTAIAIALAEDRRSPLRRVARALPAAGAELCGRRVVSPCCSSWRSGRCTSPRSR